MNIKHFLKISAHLAKIFQHHFFHSKFSLKIHKKNISTSSQNQFHPKISPLPSTLSPHRVTPHKILYRYLDTRLIVALLPSINIPRLFALSAWTNTRITSHRVVGVRAQNYYKSIISLSLSQISRTIPRSTPLPSTQSVHNQMTSPFTQLFIIFFFFSPFYFHLANFFFICPQIDGKRAFASDCPIYANKSIIKS